MKLRQIRTENFAGLPDRTFELASDRGEAATTVLVLGPGSSGKTSLLHAIIAAKEHAAAYGRRPDLRARARRPDRSVVLETVWELDAQERDRAPSKSPTIGMTLRAGNGEPLQIAPSPLMNILGAYDHSPDSGKLDFFPETRCLEDTWAGVLPPRDVGEEEERLLRLSTSSTKYNGLWAYFRELTAGAAFRQEARLRQEGALFADEAGAPLAPLREALEKLGGPVSLIGHEGEALLFQDARGQRFTTERLSCSARDALLIAASILRVGHTRSVVLFDRLELFRSASEAARLLRGIRGLVGNSQIIATTCSNELLHARIADCVINLGEAR